MIVEAILGVAEKLFGFRERFKAAELARRGRISDLFERIGQCLTDVHTELEQGGIPHGKCQEMLIFARALPNAINKEVGDEEATELGKQLEKAHNVEYLLGDLGQRDRDEGLRMVDEAAGTFRALSALIRV